MEEKGETLSGPMLREKRKRSKHDFGIPDEMGVTDWIASFPPLHFEDLQYQRIRHAYTGSLRREKGEKLQNHSM